MDPDTDGDKFNGGADVVGPPVVSGNEASHLFGVVDGAFDEVALTIDPSARDEGALAHQAWQRVGPSTPRSLERPNTVGAVRLVRDDSPKASAGLCRI